MGGPARQERHPLRLRVVARLRLAPHAHVPHDTVLDAVGANVLVREAQGAASVLSFPSRHLHILVPHTPSHHLHRRMGAPLVPTEDSGVRRRGRHLHGLLSRLRSDSTPRRVRAVPRVVRDRPPHPRCLQDDAHRPRHRLQRRRAGASSPSPRQPPRHRPPQANCRCHTPPDNRQCSHARLLKRWSHRPSSAKGGGASPNPRCTCASVSCRPRGRLPRRHTQASGPPVGRAISFPERSNEADVLGRRAHLGTANDA
mmetsp:Transcript_60730/g.131820  ORF Transcript_60730/g.131820 Transcript_60730/m.131820 type:complete len:256 (-) Transcript_60730:240-1007(-)